MKPITRGTLRTRCQLRRHDHLNQDIAREELRSFCDAGRHDLNHFFGRDHDFAK
ncbi:hypothetical protein I6I33_11295 [Klebsiella pneumoniae]|nr:hypothetical protein I6I33_11295 [Klebsiella pneumoniae]